MHDKYDNMPEFTSRLLAACAGLQIDVADAVVAQMVGDGAFTGDAVKDAQITQIRQSAQRLFTVMAECIPGEDRKAVAETFTALYLD